MACRRWSTGLKVAGLCSFELTPDRENPTKACSVCVTPQPASRVVNLRAFSADAGALLWEVTNFTTFGNNPNGAVYGYRWRDVTSVSTYTYIATHFVPVLFTAAVFDSTTKFQEKSAVFVPPTGTTRVADCIRVNIDGTKTVIMQEAARSFAEESPWGIFSESSNFSSQIHNCSTADEIYGRPSVPGGRVAVVEITDKNIRVKKHQIRFLPCLLFNLAGHTASWCLRSDSTTVRFGLYATAADVISAISTIPGVESVQAEGGPLCANRMDVTVTFTTSTQQFSHLCIEFGDTDLPSASTSGAYVSFGSGIWSLQTHAPLAPLCLKSLPISGGDAPSFVAETNGLICTGNWGPVSGSGRKKALSLLRWVMPDPAATPNWGTINTKVWEAVPFDGMIQTQEWLQTGREVGLQWGVTAVKAGKLAVTSAARRFPVLDGGEPFTTHIIYDAVSGAGISSGYAGFLSGMKVLFGESGGQYRFGQRKRFTPSGGDTGGYWDVGYVESFGSDNDLADLRETDVVDAFGVGSKKVTVISGWTSSVVSAQFSSSQNYVSPAASTSYSYSRPWMVVSATSASSATFPFGSFRTDYFYTFSLLTRFSASTEWRLEHGNSIDGIFTAHKSTSWFPLLVSLETVKAEMQAWYGNITGGTVPILKINQFGDDPFLPLLSPQVPTFQLLREIRVHRDIGTPPNPLASLAPVFANRFRLSLRNSRKVLTHSIIGSNPATGEIQWQRDVGITPGTNNPAPCAATAFLNNTLVVRTACKAGVDMYVYPRGS